LAAASDIIARFGADSLPGVTAAVMLGSTETTFYTISVYFGSLGIRDTRYAVPAALCADIAGFAAAAFFSRLFFG
ncbi:MAG: spore maturation protein, partial [Oscillospiraceae bacterium]|nr:spore maturation protein [Oscillospiraceae bacterium]